MTNTNQPESAAERLRRAAFTLYSGKAVPLDTALEIVGEVEQLRQARNTLLLAIRQRIAQLEQEKATLRAALTTALEGLEDMLPYVPAYFAEKWKHQEYVEAARQALTASKGADDGNDLTNSGDHE